MTSFASVERWGRVSPFGVRFVDDHGGRVVADGLSVKSWPTDEPSRFRAARLNRTDAFYLNSAPGLRDLELGEGDDAYWQGLPPGREFTFEVEDAKGRFLPFRFTAHLPLRGLMRLACGSPPTVVPLPLGAEPDGVPLFSAPARPKTPGTVLIRADLWDSEHHVPAAWATLEARTPGARLRGEAPVRAIADHRGSVALHFPIPDEADVDGGTFDSPIGAAGAPLALRTWAVEVQATYGRMPLAVGTERRVTPPIPNLCASLAQPPARLWDRLGAAPVEITKIVLSYGQETLLRSVDVGAEPPSVLLLTPSQSPP